MKAAVARQESARVTMGFSETMTARLYRPEMTDPSLLARQWVVHSLMDWMAVSVAGADEEVTRIVLDVLASEGNHPVSSVVGSREQLSAANAAFVNAVSSHSQDYDSSNLWSLGHTMTSVAASAIAFGEELDCSGRELQTAILRGTEAASIVGLATANLRKSRGLHLTGYSGAFGAAAACVSLMGLDKNLMLQSMGLAATQAAGLRAVFGTMGKSLNAGTPARNGVLTAKMVAAGFTGPEEAITGPSGYARAYAIDFSAERPGEVMGDRAGIQATIFKFHSNCHGIHAVMDAIATLMQNEKFSHEHVNEVILTVPIGVLSLCPFHDPASETEAQFSVPHAVALVLAGRSTGPGGFTHQMLNDPLLKRLRQKVKVRPSSSDTAVDCPAEILVVLVDGRQIRVWSASLSPVADTDLPRQFRRLEAKFMRLAEPVIGKEKAGLLLEAIIGLESLASVRDLGELMRGS